MVVLNRKRSSPSPGLIKSLLYTGLLVLTGLSVYQISWIFNHIFGHTRNHIVPNSDRRFHSDQYSFPATHHVQHLRNGTSSFQASRFPIFPQYSHLPAREVPIINVRILLFQHKAREIIFREATANDYDDNDIYMSDELMNICRDGFQRSSYFQYLGSTVVPDCTLQPNFTIHESFSENGSREEVWVIDMRRMIYGQVYTIPHQLLHLLQLPAQKPPVKIVFIDYRDRMPKMKFCTKIMEKIALFMGQGNMRYVLQQIVRNRYWDEHKLFPQQGKLRSLERETCFGGPIVTIPYTVRTEYIVPDIDFSTSHRPVHVAHFWNYSTDCGHCELRNHVTRLVESLSGSSLDIDIRGKTETIFALGALVSETGSKGRTTLNQRYLNSLKEARIVVVAQRDSWEDHYRFFEAIIGGALVMTDPMLSLPEGFEDGVNVILYWTLDDLREKILYYLDPAHERERLRIAKAGWTLALLHHQPLHWMERVFLGRRSSLLSRDST